LNSATRERIEDRLPKIWLIVGERIRNARVNRAVAFRERHRPRFRETGSNERIAHTATRHVEQMIGHGAKPIRTQFIGQLVVPAQTRDLLDQVHLVRHIVTPRRRRNAVRAIGAGLDRKSNRRKQAFDLFFLNMHTEQLIDARGTQTNGRRRRRSVAHINQGLDRSTGNGYDQPRGEFCDLRSRAAVHTALEAIARIR